MELVQTLYQCKSLARTRLTGSHNEKIVFCKLARGGNFTIDWGTE